MRPGYHHDVCSTVQPMAAAAPFFRECDPESRGVRLVHPEINFAHPLDGGAGGAVRPVAGGDGGAGSGRTRAAYRRLFGPLVEHGTDVVDFFLTSQLRRPPTRSVPQIAHFGLNGLPNVRWLAHRYFDTEEARALLGGAAAHGMLDLSQPLTSALGMLLAMLSHHVGLAADRGRLAEARRRDGHRARGAGRRGRHRPPGHRPARVRGRAGGAARHHARGVRRHGRRPGARGLPPLGVAVPARRRRLQDRLDPVRAGALDEPRRPPGRDDPRRRHPRRDDRGGAGAATRAG